MSMNCADYTDLILRLSDGELGENDTELLRAHLARCPNCRREFRAMKNVMDHLGTLEEAPEYIAENVMARIRIQGMKEDAVNVRSNATSGKATRKKHARRRVGKVLAIAACFAIFLGGGSYLASHLLNAIDSAGSGASQSAVLEEPHTVANAAAEAPMAAEAAAQDSGADSFPAEEALEAEPAAEAMDSSFSSNAAARGMVYTRDNPAQVPAGREEDFEALIQDVGWPNGVPETSWEVFAAVEHQGVIYEFLTDPDGEYLLWRDAAETVVAIHSPGSVEDVWNIIG